MGQREVRWVCRPCGISSGLFSFGRAMMEAQRQFFGNMDLRKYNEKNEQSQPDVIVLCWMTNSG